MSENQMKKEIQQVSEEEVEQLMQSLPKVTIMNNKLELVNYQGFWHPSLANYLKSTLLFQRHFRARNTDLIIASFPKTGTTWLKSLLFSVVNRFNYPNKDQTPLLKHHPHELVYRLEVDVYGNAFEYPQPQHLDDLPSPRLLHTHLPYTSLPESIMTSRCRVLYIGRNPLDTVVSLYYFSVKMMKNMEGEDFRHPSMEEFFEDFYTGRVPHGPFFEHMVGYWNQSLERPDKVLFFKYEDLNDNQVFYVKKLAEFVGMPFSTKEESQGVIDDIVEMCSINNMKELEVNKSGVINKYFEKESYFRKGEVGDWTHHLSPSMVERMNTLSLMLEKLEGTSLSFKMLSSQ
ncbi:flavonol sulfotransferase-like [Spinacia oleracea]|uniref:Sulfotransferase n=1 Tax=Spinacia oleracea TaxID=3562 RepID=A0A9R0IIG7_SPIOL|nr:flavonol sulfotransferase-like [Spinacia oleracea]